PASELASEILEPLGTVVTLASEQQFETAATLGCMHGWVYPWLAAMSVWAEQQGLDAEAAAELARSSVAGAVAFSQSMSADHIAAIGEGIASEGTYTLAGLKVLQSGGGIEAWMAAMNTVNDKALGR
ncbi:MAG: pyrroline-5-carboxylate reductase dimerization domain-containing protein, partial [Granulosicoccaceae bacterium]